MHFFGDVTLLSLSFSDHHVVHIADFAGGDVEGRLSSCDRTVAEELAHNLTGMLSLPHSFLHEGVRRQTGVLSKQPAIRSFIKVSFFVGSKSKLLEYMLCS